MWWDGSRDMVIKRWGMFGDVKGGRASTASTDLKLLREAVRSKLSVWNGGMMGVVRWVD
jgi:hypothetical protein